MNAGATNLKRLATGAAAASLLAFGGVAYAQQQEAKQAPQGQEQQQTPGDEGGDCPRKQNGGQGSTQTEA